MPLVQEARRGSSLKIVAAVLGGLLCADLIARIPFDGWGAGGGRAAPESAVASSSRTETTGSSLSPSPAPVAAVPVAAPPAPESTRSAAREAEAVPPPAAAPPPEQQAKANAGETNNNSAEGLPCEQQTWPYLDGRCKEAAAATAAPGSRQVRVIAKDSTAPTAVVTPLPAEIVDPRRDAIASREAAKTQSNRPEHTAPAPSRGDQMTLAAAPAELKPEPDAAPVNGNVLVPRPAPESIRKPAADTVSPQPTIRELVSTPERSTRRESRDRARSAKAQKSEKQRFTRSQPTAEPDSRSADLRRAGITESRAYQLPSGRRIVVFRQSNGEVGIAPDRGGGGGSYFFGW